MKHLSTLKAALVAGALSLQSCDEAPGTAKNTQSTRDQTEAILVKPAITRGESEYMAIVLRFEDRKRLYDLLDKGEKTSEYFSESIQYYGKQGKDYELSGRLADVRARLMTLGYLIDTHGISEEEVKKILDYGILISGKHEDQLSPRITIQKSDNTDALFQGDAPLTSTLNGGTLILKKGNNTLKVDIQY